MYLDHCILWLNTTSALDAQHTDWCEVENWFSCSLTHCVARHLETADSIHNAVCTCMSAHQSRTNYLMADCIINTLKFLAIPGFGGTIKQKVARNNRQCT